ncbi:MAG: Hsp20/alpha crystallin family protein [Phycisphaerales bacterium]|nr:MAG: Hsp20/alpha crystallin family protein [Phycisphaerales bacterium]
MTTCAIDKPANTEVVRAERTQSERYYRPNVDIIESTEELTVHADVPGVKADDVGISFENGTLTIHGKVNKRTPENVNYALNEYGVGDFYRTFQVSEKIDSAKISAECADGVLTLHLPKAEAARPRKIDVKTG